MLLVPVINHSRTIKHKINSQIILNRTLKVVIITQERQWVSLLRKPLKVYHKSRVYSGPISCLFQKMLLTLSMSRASQWTPLNVKSLVNNSQFHIFLSNQSNFLCRVYIDIFRPFSGFKSVRLIPREKKPDEKVILCFADFENPFQTTLVINTLQVISKSNMSSLIFS